MEYVDILGIVGFLAGIIGVVALNKRLRYIFGFSSVISLLIYGFIRPFLPLTVIMSVLLVVFFCVLIKAETKKIQIKLEETDAEDEKVKEFMKIHKKDIYSFFPFYQFNENQKFFIITKENYPIGIFIYTISGDILTVEVDYTKHIYRDLGTGNYIYNKNPGYFKKIGVNTILSQSFNRTYSRSLKKNGFRNEIIGGQQFFVKNLD
ncbi:hypothetical protein LJC11_02080 [Bacteroidales bacterium OttesenSCG-928-I21]|nr:hypothetical protein [Bacteroidales bacterium OttesenSCG-928-I21]